jgi:hypothetical protein
MLLPFEVRRSSGRLTARNVCIVLYWRMAFSTRRTAGINFSRGSHRELSWRPVTLRKLSATQVLPPLLEPLGLDIRLLRSGPRAAFRRNYADAVLPTLFWNCVPGTCSTCNWFSFRIVCLFVYLCLSLVLCFTLLPTFSFFSLFPPFLLLSISAPSSCQPCIPFSVHSFIVYIFMLPLFVSVLFFHIRSLLEKVL